MNNRTFIIIVLVLCMAIVGVVAYFLLSDMPRISKNECQKLLSDYKDDLIELYAELNAGYERAKAENSPDTWEGFSTEWMPKLLNVRPDIMGDKFPEGYEEIKMELMAAQSYFMPLWVEYNKEFEGKETDPEKIDELKSKIENILDNVEI